MARPIKKLSGGPLGTPLGYSPLGGPNFEPGINISQDIINDPFVEDEITSLVDQALPLSLWREPPKFFGQGVLGGAEEQATGGVGVYGEQDLEVGGEIHTRSPYRDTTDQGRGWFDVLQDDPFRVGRPVVDLVGATPTTDPSRLFSPDTRITKTPTGLIDSAFDKAYFNYSQDDKMLNTGRHGFAETFWRLSDPTRPPIISDTPYVTGPQVNRATGEITEAPLSWLSLDRTPENAVVGPSGPVVGGGDPVDPVDPVGPIVDDTGLWNPDDDFIDWSTSDTPEVWTPDTTRNIIDWNVDFGEDDLPVGYGWGTPDATLPYGGGLDAGDITGRTPRERDFRFYDYPGMTDPPMIGPQLPAKPDDRFLGTGLQDPIVIRHPRPLTGETIQNIGGKPSLSGKSPYKPSKASTILDASKNIVTDVVGGVESMSDAIFGKTRYDQYPRPEKEKEVARLLGKAKDLVRGWSDETFLLWETQGVPSSLGDRTPFGPDYIKNAKNLVNIIKNEDEIKTQEYGNLQYIALLNLAKMVSLYGPMGAIPATFVTLSKEIMSGLKNAFADHPEFRGNPVQDVIHGTTWVLGQTLQKTYNATLGKLIDKIDGDKLKENLSKLNIVEYMKAPDVPTGVKITYTPPKTTRLSGQGGEPQMPIPDIPPTGEIPTTEPVRIRRGEAGEITGEAVKQLVTDPFTSITSDRDEFKGQPIADKVQGEIVGEKPKGELETGRGEDKKRELEQEQEERERLKLGEETPETDLPELDPETLKELEEEGITPAEDPVDPYAEYRSASGLYKIDFGDNNPYPEGYLPEGNIGYFQEGSVESELSKGGKLVKWGEETGGETGDDERGKGLDQPLNLWLPVDSWGNQYGDTDFDENDIVGVNYRPHWPKEGEGEEFEREANRLGDQWTAAQGTGDEKPDTGQPETGQTDFRSDYQKQMGLTVGNVWANESDRSTWPAIAQSQIPHLNPKGGADLMYNSALPSSNLEDHPQYYGNNPESHLNVEPDVNVEYTPADKEPTADEIESVAYIHGMPRGTTYMRFMWLDREGIQQEGTFPVDTTIAGSGTAFTWDYDWGRANLPMGAEPAQGWWPTGGSFNVVPGP